ncbi:MAG: CotH kinase family protein [Myxococcota bacterium]
METLLNALLAGPVAPHGGVVPQRDGASILFADDHVLELAIEIEPDDLDALDRDPRTDVHATVTFEGTSWLVGFHLKGASSYRGLDDKAAMKLDFGAWVPEQEFWGVRRVTLNNMIYDESMMRERGAYRLYEAMGIRAPRHGYAWVTVNGEDYGLYSVIETMDQGFLDRAFAEDPDGNLYESVYNWGDLTWTAMANYTLQEEGAILPWEDLTELVEDLDGSYDTMRARFDMDSVLGVFAMDLALGHYDGYTRNFNNYLVYHAPAEDRWHLVPWGQDGTFNSGGPLHIGFLGRLAVDCLGSSACRDDMDAKVLEIADLMERIGLAAWLEETWTMIRPYCEADPRREVECDPSDVLEYAWERPAEIRAELL